MFRAARTVVVGGWLFLIIGVLAAAANSWGFTVLQGIANPAERQARAEYTVKAFLYHSIGHVDRKDAVTAVQRYFVRGLLGGALSLLMGIGLLSRREGGRKLCILISGLCFLWFIGNVLYLLRSGVAWLPDLLMRVAGMIGFLSVALGLTRSSIKAQFQRQT